MPEASSAKATHPWARRGQGEVGLSWEWYILEPGGGATKEDAAAV